MALNSLKDIYIDQLQDLRSANAQSIEATRTLADHASDPGLETALKDGVDGIQRGIDTVDEILKGHAADPKGEFCKGMEGLVKEIDAHVVDAEFGGDDVRDAMIVTQYQRMSHYGIAGYGCVVAFAKQLGLMEDATKLEKCLDGAYKGDRDMTEIATVGLNKAAA
ncbi:MAG: DUF892 family protein [Pseudomonadota bacterium]